MEPGFAEAAEWLAAQNALQLMADRNGNISEHEVDLIEHYVARLVAGAELDQVKGAELAAEWLLWCVELAELATQRRANDSPSKARQALEEGLGQLDLSRAKSLGLAKPVKRILKV